MGESLGESTQQCAHACFFLGNMCPEALHSYEIFTVTSIAKGFGVIREPSVTLSHVKDLEAIISLSHSRIQESIGRTTTPENKATKAARARTHTRQKGTLQQSQLYIYTHTPQNGKESSLQHEENDQHSNSSSFGPTCNTTNRPSAALEWCGLRVVA
jgi:hypothetical protein